MSIYLSIYSHKYYHDRQTLVIIEISQGWAIPGFGQLYYTLTILEETITILYNTYTNTIPIFFGGFIHAYIYSKWDKTLYNRRHEKRSRRPDAVWGNFSGLRKFFVHITAFFTHCRVLGNFTCLWKYHPIKFQQI